MSSGLEQLVGPRSVAVVGASSDPAKHGARVVANLRRVGFDGPLWAVNRRSEPVPAVDGVRSTLGELPEPVDTVVCAVPAIAVEDVVRDAGKIGARWVVVFSAGFAEAGPEGRQAQQRLAAVAADSGVRLLGPNSGGVVCPANRVALSFLTWLDRPVGEIRTGPVGLVTQSGGTGSYVHNLAAARGGGLAVSISTGNEADLGVAEAVTELASWETVRAVAVVLETVRHGAAFVQALTHARLLGKPVVVCQLGRSRLSGALMEGHTGALAVEERVLDGLFDAQGVVRARTPEEMLDVADVLAAAPVPGGNRVGIVTHSGGTAILLADLAADDQLHLPPLSASLQHAIEPYLQSGTKANPADLGSIIGGPKRFGEVVRRFRDSGDFDTVLAVSTPHPPAHSAERADDLAAMSNGEPEVPVVHLWMAGDLGASGLERLRTAGTPVVEEPRAAIRALAGLCRLATTHRRPSDHPQAGERAESAAEGSAGPDAGPVAGPALSLPIEAGVISEGAARTLLGAWGIETCAGETVHSRAQAEVVAERIGYPVVAKIDVAGVPHKSAIGAVRLDLRSASEVGSAYDAVYRAAPARSAVTVPTGVLITCFEPGLELLVGCVVDTVFGPVAALGLGGTSTELLDLAVTAPVDGGGQPGRRLLERFEALLPAGLGGLAKTAPTPPDWEALVRVVDRLVGAFVAGQPRLAELEINPLIWTGARWKAADAMVKLAEPVQAGRSSGSVPT